MSNTIENHEEYYSLSFADLDLSHQTFSGIEFDSCTFTNCDFSETTFDRCKFIDCGFEKCNLSLARLGYSRFVDITFTSSKLVGVDWTKAQWPNILPDSPISFHSCILNDSSFFGLSLPELKLTECKAHDVDFRESKLNEATFDYTDLTSSLFNNTDLTSASFVEASNYDIDINFNRVQKARFTRYEATRLLESLGIELVD
ncbi:pentapeptide repeat-containing protein [Parendozoicomonas haliclonae]|uniref:Pentapeptide repeats (8 copies) n=1 Tax=Parendozoicomonas haliclonae TaxID=1960125 RepID=A0A1X7AS18_9GAMM|nr:pentapeptide repeat-containing protein [Parendozoicomonas haliclonae]SMA50217.1 Pentapeptide repeats (8 copies) [Parendozoicomonas haliclonae]